MTTDADRRARVRADYEKLVQEATREAKEQRERFETPSGIERRRLYTSEDVQDELESLGYPGIPPYTRGVQPTMYRGRHWTMRQYAGFGSPVETNARFKKLLEEGQTGLSVAFDLPTQIGYDSDDSLAAGEVGKVGVPISSIHDAEALLADLPLDKVSISMTINSSAAVLLAYLVAVAKRRGLAPAKLSGTTQNDILKEYVARGTFRFPIAPSMRLVTDTFRYCSQSLPKWNPISISGYHIREAGSTAVQELAFTFGNAIAYVEAAKKAGLAPDKFMPRLSFFFACHSDFLEEVAKFRAARRLWAKIASDLGAKDERSLKCRFHVQTGGVTLTAKQPEVNVVRVALQALSAVLGGCQSLHTNAKDEALALPTEESAVLALRTQQVVAYETGVTDTVDPLGGSYALEALTDELEKRTLDLLQKIKNMGGMVRAIELGFPQEAIRGSAYDHQKRVESGDRVIVGVNRFTQSEEGKKIPLLRIDEKVQKERAQKLMDLRKRRDAKKVDQLLASVEEAARTDGAPLVEPLVAAVEGECTTGEIMGRLSKVFGEYEDADAY